MNSCYVSSVKTDSPLLTDSAVKYALLPLMNSFYISSVKTDSQLLTDSAVKYGTTALIEFLLHFISEN